MHGLFGALAIHQTKQELRWKEGVEAQTIYIKTVSSLLLSTDDERVKATLQILYGQYHIWDLFGICMF